PCGSALLRTWLRGSRGRWRAALRVRRWWSRACRGPRAVLAGPAQLAEWDVRVAARFLGQPEHPLGKDVLHDLLGAAEDPQCGGRQQQLVPGIGAPHAGVADQPGTDDLGGEVGAPGEVLGV